MFGWATTRPSLLRCSLHLQGLPIFDRAQTGAAKLAALRTGANPRLFRAKDAFSPNSLSRLTSDGRLDLQSSAAELLQELTQLISRGLQQIVLTGIPDVGLIPRYEVDGDGVLDGAHLQVV